MAETITYEAASPNEVPWIVKERVSSYKELFFSEFYSETSEENRKEYFSKIITSPKDPTDWMAHYFCPNFPRTADCQLLFVLTTPKPEQGKPGYYFVKIYQDEEAKEFLADPNRA